MLADSFIRLALEVELVFDVLAFRVFRFFGPSAISLAYSSVVSLQFSPYGKGCGRIASSDDDLLVDIDEEGDDEEVEKTIAKNSNKTT